MKPTVMVIGGAGYIGSHVCKLLDSLGYPVVVFDNLVYGHRDLAKWGEFVLGDCADREALLTAMNRFGVGAVMHFAAYTYVGESVTDPEKYYANNLANTLNVLSALREREGAPFIFSSTCAVYGVPESVPITEDQPLNPYNPYGRTKFMVEKVLADYDAAYGLKYASLRYFNAAGADPDSETGEDHDPETHLIPLVLMAALGKRPNISIFGTEHPTPDGTCVRDYIHVADLAQAHLLALEYLLAEKSSLVVNLGNGQGHSVRQVIDTAREVTGKPIPVVEAPPRAGDLPVLVGSSAKAETLLGWKPRHAELREILTTAWNWHQKRHGVSEGETL